MPIVAVINRKGGSGKSTLATHIAVYWARRGVRVMLGDIDRQQSARSWLARRPAQAPFVYPWAIDKNSVLRVPTGVTHVVIDTPGGLHGYDLAKVVMYTDFVVMPVSPSVFDLSSASQCYAEVSSLPRVASGRCRIAVVGMRLEPSERSEQALEAWAKQRNLPFLGIIHRSEQYTLSVEAGRTIFDQKASAVARESADWQHLMVWLDSEVASRPMILNELQEEPATPLSGSNGYADTHVAATTLNPFSENYVQTAAWTRPPSASDAASEVLRTPATRPTPELRPQRMPTSAATLSAPRFPNLSARNDKASRLYTPVQGSADTPPPGSNIPTPAHPNASTHAARASAAPSAATLNKPGLHRPLAAASVLQRSTTPSPAMSAEPGQFPDTVKNEAETSAPLTLAGILAKLRSL